MPKCFQSIQTAFKSWIDDFIVHARTEEVLIAHLKDSFQICKDYRIILAASRCKFYAKRVKWSYRIIDASGYRFDYGTQKLSELLHFQSLVMN